MSDDKMKEMDVLLIDAQAIFDEIRQSFGENRRISTETMGIINSWEADNKERILREYR